MASIVGVKPHVLRYWESEFKVLKPMKTRGSHRQYRRRDVEFAMRIKQLLHDEGYTIAGAKMRMRELGEHKLGAELPERANREVELRAALLGVREELTGLLERMDRIADDARAAEEQPSEVTIHRAVLVPSRKTRS